MMVLLGDVGSWLPAIALWSLAALILVALGLTWVFGRRKQ